MNEIPQGYELVTEGTVQLGDKTWSVETKTWLDVDEEGLAAVREISTILNDDPTCPVKALHAVVRKKPVEPVPPCGYKRVTEGELRVGDKAFTYDGKWIDVTEGLLEGYKFLGVNDTSKVIAVCRKWGT